MDTLRNVTNACIENQTSNGPSPHSMSSKIEEGSLELEAALNLLPTTFSGINQEELEHFLKQCECVLTRIDNRVKPQLLQRIMVCLTGNARAAVECHTINTWDELKNTLKNSIPPKGTTKQLFFELYSIKQKSNEDVATYSERIKSIQAIILKQKISGKSQLRRAAMEATLQAQTLQTFIEGLGTLTEFMKVKNPSSLEKAIQAAIEEERTRKLFEESKRLSESPNKKKSSNNTETEKPPIVCFKCGQIGHLSRECRSPQSTNNLTLDVTCNYCKLLGHYKTNCPKLLYVTLKKEKGLWKL